MLLLDSREGSYQLASHEPVRSLLAPCADHNTPSCSCRDTSRQLSTITTSSGAGGPDALIVGQGPESPLLVAIEVKSIRDLFSSAADGRLQSQSDGQLQAMLSNYQQSWLVYYGAIRCGDSGHLEEPKGRGDNGRVLWKPFTRNGGPDGDGRPLPCEFLDSMLVAVAALGVIPWYLPNIKAVARWIGTLHAWWTKPWDEHTFTHTFNQAPRFPMAIPGVTPQELARARRVFDRYTGLGIQKSVNVAKHFPSVKAMANATEEEWREVKGIGPGLSRAIVAEFNE